MSVRKTTKSDALLIPLIDAKLHLRVDSNFDDSEIYGLIRAAQDYAEGFTGQAIPVNTFEFTFTNDPIRARAESSLDICELSDRITLRVGPVVSLTSISTYDQAGAETEIDIAGYECVNYDQYSEIIRKDGENVSRGTRSYRDFIMLFKAGYTEATLPFALRQALLALIAFYYDNRDGSGDGQPEPPHGIRDMLLGFRLETL